MSTHPSDALYSSFSQIHRAVVQYSSTATGEIQVIIPSVTGNDTTVPISFFGREAHPFENDWVVPSVGDTIIVCREDEDYTNVFWINTTYNPVRADVGEANPTSYNFGPTGSVSAFDLVDFGSTPTSSGLYLGSVNMGYYDSPASEWRTYMDYTGNFYLRGSGSHALTWNGSTLAVTGTITVGSTALTESNTLNTNTTAANVGLGNVDNLNSQGQAQAGLITGTTITGGGITLSGGGAIKGGQTGYDTGTGFFLGYSSGYKFSIGNASGDKLTWNGSTLAVTGTITATDGEIGGWTVDADSMFSGTKDTIGYADGGGITISSGGSIHAKQFYIDTSGNAFFKGNLSGADITGASGTFGGTVSGATLTGNTITGGSITTGDITITGLGTSGIDIGTGANSWHMDSTGQQWWGNHASYAAAKYKIAAWGGAYLLYARIGGAVSGSDVKTGKAWEINDGNITNVSTINSIVSTDYNAVGINSVSGIIRTAGSKVILRGYSGGDIRVGISQTTADQPEYNQVNDVAIFWDDSASKMYFSVEQALLVAGGEVTINNNPTVDAGLTLTGTPTNNSGSYMLSRNAGGDLVWNGSTLGGVDWTVDQGATNIHSGNYTNTTYSVGDNGLTQKNFTTTLKSKLDGIAYNANNYTHPLLNHIPTGGSPGQFLEYNSPGLALWSNPPADSTKLPLTGGTMSGGITFSNGNHITGSYSSNVYFQGGINGTAWLRAHSASSARIKCGSGGDIVFYASPRPNLNTGQSLGTSNLWWNYSYHYKMDFSSIPSASGNGWYMWMNNSDQVMHASSSERIKKDIVTIPISESLDRINALRPVEFTPRADHSDLKIDGMWEYERFKGFIAEEAAEVDHGYGVYNWWKSDDPESEDYDKVLPSLSSLQDEWTDEEVAAYYDLDKAKPQMFDLHAILADSVGAIQELSNKLDAAEARIAVLETA